MTRRHRHDSMQPIDATSWLVVEDQYGKPIYVEELPPATDPRMVMIRAMSRSIREGFEVEELPGTIPIYFCRKEADGQPPERRLVKIARRHPGEKLESKHPEPWRDLGAANVTPLKRN